MPGATVEHPQVGWNEVPGQTDTFAWWDGHEWDMVALRADDHWEYIAGTGSTASDELPQPAERFGALRVLLAGAITAAVGVAALAVAVVAALVAALSETKADQDATLWFGGVAFAIGVVAIVASTVLAVTSAVWWFRRAHSHPGSVVVPRRVTIAVGALIGSVASFVAAFIFSNTRASTASDFVGLASLLWIIGTALLLSLGTGRAARPWPSGPPSAAVGSGAVATTPSKLQFVWTRARGPALLAIGFISTALGALAMHAPAIGPYLGLVAMLLGSALLLPGAALTTFALLRWLGRRLKSLLDKIDV